MKKKKFKRLTAWDCEKICQMNKYNCIESNCPLYGKRYYCPWNVGSLASTKLVNSDAVIKSFLDDVVEVPTNREAKKLFDDAYNSIKPMIRIYSKRTIYKTYINPKKKQREDV